MKKKILYITLVNDGTNNGGMTARKAIGKALAACVGEDNIDVITSELDHSEWTGNVIYNMKHYFFLKEKIRNVMQGNITQISNTEIQKIINIIQENKYDIVVLGCSESGRLIKSVKSINIKVITFYLDIIANAVKTKLKNKFSFAYIPVALSEFWAEKMTTDLSDSVVVLNQRDADCLRKQWKRVADAIIPICVEDRFRDNEVIPVEKDERLKILFVGTFSWGPNEEGIRWFCDAVMTKLLNNNVTLYIAGFGTERMKEDNTISSMKNVEILGTVDDLASIYGSMDVVVSPILSGTGMKTKTAEALMHGKYILATKEAIEGFTGLEDSLCHSENDFISRIKMCCKHRPERYIEANRNIYINNYSVEAVTNKIKAVIENTICNNY